MKKLLLASVASAVVAISGASAAPIPVGDNIGLGTGGFQAVNGSGTNVVFTSAVKLDFVPLGGTTGSFATSFATSGVFLSAIGAGVTGTIQDLTFSPFSGPINSFWTVTSGSNTASFDLESLTINTQTNAAIVLTGKGTMHLTGYDATPGTWSFSGNTNGTSTLGTFTWSADATPTAVPEPMSLVLLGSGLLGLAGMRRIRR